MNDKKEECSSCKRGEDEANHPRGMVFVGWGHGWQPCPRCEGTTRVPVSGQEESED